MTKDEGNVPVVIKPWLGLWPRREKGSYGHNHRKYFKENGANKKNTINIERDIITMSKYVFYG